MLEDAGFGVLGAEVAAGVGVLGVLKVALEESLLELALLASEPPLEGSDFTSPVVLSDLVSDFELLPLESFA